MSAGAEPPEAEVVTGEPVTQSAVEPVRSGGTVEVSNRQVATLAATGFAAGVVTAAVIGRRGGPLKRRRRRKGPLGEVLSSNSFLVDVHVLKR
jgi:hypothetical protein